MRGSTVQPGFGRQGGATLVVVLILLLLMMLLGMAAMRGVIMQERMAMNTFARSMAFQAAETTLRVAEAEAAALADSAFDNVARGTCSSQGLCVPSDTGTSGWQAANFWDTSNRYRTATGAAVSNGIAPRYVIESMGRMPTEEEASVDLMNDTQPPMTFRFFRITVRSKGPDGSEVLLQSVYRGT